ncbi:MAG: type III-B CRISPR module RAMP protein Cmr6 [Nitrososphaeria archaeon]
MSVSEWAVKAYVRFSSCTDCALFKRKINSAKDLISDEIKDETERIFERNNLNDFLLVRDIADIWKKLKDQLSINQDNSLMIKLHDLALFLREPEKGSVLYEVLHADERVKSPDLYTYAARMDVADKYIKEVAEAMHGLGQRSFIATACVVGPIVAGRGFLDLALEYGLSWDAVLDLPYVQASELKGAVRSTLLKLALISEEKRNTKLRSALDVLGKSMGRIFTNEEERALKSLLEGLELTVGEKEQHVGWMRISDAYPVSAPNGRPVELLVLTPHYTPDVHQEYHVSPIPIRYIGIPRGTTIKFAVSVTEEGLRALSEVLGEQNEKDALMHVLSTALELGVGRRTSRGMGRMKLEGLDEVSC